VDRYKKQATPILAIALLTVLIVISIDTVAQKKQSKYFFMEVKYGVLSGFGPSKNQAELVGGIDTLSFDKKLHLIPGFKNSYPIYVTMGYMANYLQIQGTLGYYSLDIGLGKVANDYMQGLLTAQMMLLKVEVQAHLSTIRKGRWDNRYGVMSSISFNGTIPLAHTMNTTRKLEYRIDSFKPSFQLNWNVDICLKIPLGKKGFYGVANAGLTMPGLVGSIGTLSTEPESPFAATRSKVKMYFFNTSIGLGYYINLKPTQPSR